jgi:hypothetical protein
MGIILSLILIAVGAILTWGVNTTGGSVDVDVVGVVLMVVGFVLFLISLVLWRTWWGAGFWGYGPEPSTDGPSFADARTGRAGGGRPTSRKMHRPGRLPEPQTKRENERSDPALALQSEAAGAAAI